MEALGYLHLISNNSVDEYSHMSSIKVAEKLLEEGRIPSGDCRDKVKLLEEGRKPRW